METTEIVEAVETPTTNNVAGFVIAGAAAVAVGVGVTFLVRKFKKDRATAKANEEFLAETE